MKTGKRFLALLMALIMSMSLLTAGAFAAETDMASDPAVEAPADTPEAQPVVVTEYVAQVGEHQYYTLQEAIDAAPSGATIKLLKDTKSPKCVVFQREGTYQLDLAGHTFTSTDQYDVIQVKSGDLDLQITNGSLVGTGKNAYGLYVYDTNDHVSVTLDGVNLEVPDQALGVQGNNTDNHLTVKNSKIKAGILAIYFPPKSGTLTIENSEVTAPTAVTVKGGSVKISGDETKITGYGKKVVPKDYYTGNPNGKLTATGDALYVESGYNDRDISVEITGGTLQSKNSMAVQMFIKKGESTGAKREIAITGGTFSSDVSAYLADGYAQNANGEVGTLEEMAIAETSIAGVTQKYVTLQEAVKAVVESDKKTGTVKLLKDTAGGGIGLFEGKGHKNVDLTIDFGGHTYSLTDPSVGSLGTESQGFHLEKTNTVKLMNGTINVAKGNTGIAMMIQNYADLTLTDLTVDGSGMVRTDGTYAMSNNHGKVLINGSTSIIAKKGDVAFDVCRFSSYPSVDVTVDTTGTIEGTIEMSASNNEIKDGCSLTIKNGNFKGTIDKQSSAENAILSISGGCFTSDPADYVAEGYTVVLSEKPGYRYEVVEKVETDVPVEPVVEPADVPETLPAEIPADKADAVKTVAGAVEIEELSAAAATAANQVTDDQAKALMEKAGLQEDADAKLKVCARLVIEPQAYDETKGVYQLDIKPVYELVAVSSDGKEVVVQAERALPMPKTTELTIPLVSGFAKNGETLYVQHKGYEHEGTAQSDAVVITNPHGFSVFTVTKSSAAVAQVGDVKYTSLQDAVKDVADKGEIKLLADCAETVTVSREVTFTLDKGTFKFTGEIKAGSGYRVTVGENGVYTVTEKSGGGSSGGSSVTGKYAVKVDSGKYGKVSVSRKAADKGDVITVTVTPDEGCALEKLTVLDKDGRKISVTEKSGGKFTFTMPASDVTVKAVFVSGTELPFADVAEDFWAAKEIAWAYENGYMTGVSEETFAPGRTVTRQQLWMVLARLAGEKPADMAAARQWAVSSGVSDGTNPGASLTRQQMVTILYRWARLTDRDVTKTAELTVFPDHASVASYAKEALSWAIGSGVLTGTSAGTLDPAGTANRAQFAVILYRFCGGM